MDTSPLLSLGWNDHFEQAFVPYAPQGLQAGRVAGEYQDLYQLATPGGKTLARIAGKMRFQALRREDLPAVGDWAVYEAHPGEAIIHAVLPRLGKFWRKAAGETGEEQILAANVDTAFLVAGLDGDFNPRRLERYLAMAWESGANPVILLNKADLCPAIEQRLADLEPIALGMPVHVMSCTLNQGLEALTPYLAPGRTVVLLGSSGVGKSTLVNRLIGEERQMVGAVREDDSRGHHTTTSRQLIRLPQGGLLIDTPGLRELQLWEADAGLEGAFAEIANLARKCRFRDCRHENEPGCAVVAALDAGELARERLESYHKLQKELAYQRRREDPVAQRAERDKWKRIHKALRQGGH